MNIATSSLLILVLLLPGIFYTRFYYSGEFSKEYFKPSFFELLLVTLIPALLLHGLWVFVTNSLCGFALDYEVLLQLMFGSIGTGDDLDFMASRVEASAGNIFWYHVTLWSVSGVLGLISKFVVRKYQFDRKFKIFRFQNEWHYLLSGEILDFPGSAGSAKNIDFVYVDALVASDEGSIIYSGVLDNYILSKEGGLQRLYLTRVKRRYLKNDSNAVRQKWAGKYYMGKYYQMPGQMFVLPYDQIINLHLTYYDIKLP